MLACIFCQARKGSHHRQDGHKTRESNSKMSPILKHSGNKTFHPPLNKRTGQLWLTCDAESFLWLRPHVGPDRLQVRHLLEPAHLLPPLCQPPLKGGVCPAKQEGAGALDALGKSLSHS